MNKITITTLMTLLLAQPLQAADISGQVMSGTDGPDTSDGGFLEIGIRASAWTRPWVGSGNKAGYGLTVAGEYRYKGLFVEAINGGVDGLNLGYQLWNDEQWTVDFIGFNAASFPEKKQNFYDAIARGQVPVTGSEAALRGAGLRLTRYFGDYIFQFRVLDDVYGDGDGGLYSTARVGRSWQYRNWNFHAIAGLEHFASQHAMRGYGVTAIEAARYNLMPYSPGSFVQTEAEVGVTYPLTEHLVFRGIVRHLLLPDAVTDSPLLEDDNRSQLLLSLSYVF